jgi:hypothetical protein
VTSVLLASIQAPLDYLHVQAVAQDCSKVAMQRQLAAIVQLGTTLRQLV